MSATPSAGSVAGAAGNSEHSLRIAEGSLLTDIAKLSVSDETAIEVLTGASGSYSGKAKNGEGYSPGVTQRYSPPFVRNGRSKSEDPFQSTPRTSATVTPKSKRIMSDWRSGSSGSEHSTSESPSVARSQRIQNASLGARDQHMGSPVSVRPGYGVVKAEEAQGHYPPSCCVFVANLLQSESEEVLQMEVTRIFREFGPVFVKIRRDAKQMPFAFCQYTTSDHADRAIQEGRGRHIKGRPCRCEKAKAHQYVVDRKPGLFLIERKFGAVITPNEARDLLQSFGEIDLCYTASHVERTALNLNEGVVVQFVMYDEGQNAYSAFRNHDTYKMQSIVGLASPARTQLRSPPSSDGMARAYLARYEVDRRSIFIGNLPAGTTEAQIHDLFEHYGHIEDVIVRETTSKFDTQEKLAFAFVEFRSTVAVTKSISAKNGFMFGGRAIRVAQKDSDSPSTLTRRVRGSNPGSSAYQSPVPRRTESQLSPVAQMSPPIYGSPYGYPYSPYYSYAPTSFVTDGQSYYPTAPYSPAYYSYQGSPSYDPRSTTPAEGTANTSTQAGYYGYSAYPYTPAPYWGSSSTEQQASSPVTYYPPAYSQSTETGNVTEDRSATPTPPGQTVVTEARIESQ